MKKKTLPDIMAWLALAFLWMAFFYTSYRATTLSIFHDEANTYFFSKENVWDILTYRNIHSNSHLFNTLLIKICVGLFGVSELAVRTPALVGHLLFLSAGFKILKANCKRGLLLPGVLFLNFNPFLLELFSCARGYALGLGFLMWGIAFCLECVKSDDAARRYQYLSWTMVSLTFAVLSQLAFLSPYVAFVVLLLGWKFWPWWTRDARRKGPWLQALRGSLKGLLPVAISLIGLLAVYFLPLRRLMAAPQFNFRHGGEMGFWQNTVGSLIWATLYRGRYQNGYLLNSGKAVVALLLGLSVAVVLSRLARMKNLSKTEKSLGCLLALVVVLSISIVWQWDLFKVKYVMDRTAVYFIPLFSVLAFLFWQWAEGDQRRVIRVLVRSFFIVLVMVSYGHFLNCANFLYYSIGPADATTKDAMTLLDQRHRDDNLSAGSVSIGVNWIYRPSVNFYRETYRMSWLKEAQNITPEETFDYYYLTTNEGFVNYCGLDRDIEVMRSLGLRVIKGFDLTDCVLAETKMVTDNNLMQN